MRCFKRCSLGLFGLVSLLPLLRAQCPESCPERRTISVNGTGVVTADADLAIVRVGYKFYAPDAKAVYAAALDASNCIMSALTASGVPKSSIESTSQVLQHTPPSDMQYPWTETERAQHQFMVTQSWVIRVKPDDAAKTLNTAINAGANESGWIDWIVQNPGPLEAEASSKSVESARLIAEQIAQKSNVHLGHLVTAQQNQRGEVFAMDGPGGGYGGGVFTSVQMGNQQLAINSRRVQFKIQVYAVFSIE
jgi:uncharacterized protein